MIEIRAQGQRHADAPLVLVRGGEQVLDERLALGGIFALGKGLLELVNHQ